MRRLEPVDPEVAKAIRQSASPMVTSRIRIGKPAVTTRGMREAEMEAIADFIDRALGARGGARVEGEVRADVAALTARFPLYPEGLR